MFNELTQQNILLNTLLGEANVSCIKTNSFELKPKLTITDVNLFDDLQNYFNDSDIKYFMIRGCNIDSLMKYSDGSYSSIIRGIQKIEGKQGYELIKPAQIAHDLYSIVKRYYDQQLLSLYTKSFENQEKNINLLKCYLDSEITAKLNAYTFFLKDIFANIDEINEYNDYRCSTLTNIQRNEIELNVLFNQLCEHIKTNIAAPETDRHKLINDYSRLNTVSTLLITYLVFEYIVGNRNDDKSIRRLEKRIKAILEMETNAIDKIKYLIGNKIDDSEYQKQTIAWRWKNTFQQMLCDWQYCSNIDSEIQQLRKLIDNLSDDFDDSKVLNKFLLSRKNALSLILIERISDYQKV